MAEDALLQLEITAPERDPIHLEVAEVVVPGSEGVFSVLPGHTPLLSTLKTGVVAGYVNNEPEFFAVNGGFAEVMDNRVVILTETVEHVDEIDVTRAQAARDRAGRWLKQKEGVDVARAEAALERSLARLQAHARDEF